jgi:precorrin-3B C17-methyltransferase
MGEAEIGMLTTVLIGNSSTVVRHGLMVTPRGYAGKYALEQGARAARDGERAGRSLSTGLEGWSDTIRQSGMSAAELAREYRLPADYIQSVLDAPLPADVVAEASAA